MKTIEIRPVTKANASEVLALKVNESQRHYIETTEQCLEDAKNCVYYKPVGLYKEGVLVGFAMYGWFPEYDENHKKGKVWLDRYLIDERFQGQGLGSIFLKTLISKLINEFACTKIFLSIYDTNIHAISLYKRYGFTFNGELDFNGEKVMELIV
ncbi:GNAT family N-acetyltransferase [Niallia sp. Man26]|uniref:GNAT family N-acetyltransferase n=1 Tax=Niallia sp. Man26 TaxID=2912824 RepID=UPI001EDC29F4|nr:GNAT family N-acetyltransferase [Niallia sp. Man26]UPO90175.1 GNAT family N-acetyltransferase [Niallia sp. Man26]